MYDRPDRRLYSFGNFDFGAGADETFSVIGPKGKAGRLNDYGVYGVVEVMNGGTVTPKVAVGSPSDADAYGDELDINALADNNAKSVRQTYDPVADSTNFNAYMIEPDIAADAEVVLTCTGATGAPTGQAVPFMVIDWDW